MIASAPARALDYQPPQRRRPGTAWILGPYAADEFLACGLWQHLQSRPSPGLL